MIDYDGESVDQAKKETLKEREEKEKNKTRKMKQKTQC